MSQRFSFLSICTALVATAALSVSSPAAADHQCSGAVKYRLWQENNVGWYEFGETVEILEGEEGHLYLHVRSGGPTPYSTSAEIGYPAAIGLGGDSHKVRRHVKMQAQDHRDRRAGRVIFTAQEPGTVYLGYELVGVKTPGRLHDVPRDCLRGRVAIRVLPRRGGHGGTVHGPREAQSSALQVVESLYRGMLRRERHGEDPWEFVDQVDREGRRGVEEVARQLLVSSEFRYQALRRTEQQRAERSRSLEQLREWLLFDIYRDLYGLLEPSRQEVDEDLRDLDNCLSSDRYAEQACTQLSRNLVTHRLFFENHRALLDDLGGRDVRRRDRPRDRYRRP